MVVKHKQRERHFLGWHAPLLPQAARFLCDRHATDGTLDLGRTVCVLPTSLAVSKLRGLLEAIANERGLAIELPAIMTVGALPGQLFRSTLPLASEFEQTLAWAAAIEKLGAEDLRPLIPTAADSLEARIDLGSILRGLHEDLAANHRSFADVATAAEADNERKRWQTLEVLYAQYLAELNRAGMADPHAAFAEAIAAGSVQSDKTIVLIGTSDLSPVNSAALATLDSPIVALVAAPESDSQRFDEFGTVVPSAWLEHHLPVSDDQLISAGDVADQAQAVAETINSFSDRFQADEIVVGVTDESQVAPIEVELRGWGVPAYRQLGWTLRETAVGRLLDLTISHLQRPSWQTLAALVRHGNVFALIDRELGERHTDWLTKLDQLLADHLPADLHAPLPADAASKYQAVAEVVHIVDRLLMRFAADLRGIGDWSKVLQEYLAEIFGEFTASGEPIRTVAATARANEVLDEFGRLNTALDPEVTGAEAVEFLTERLGDLRFGTERDTDQVQIIGWLDLALADSPALVVAGLNHPFVPEPLTGDPFLPGKLRTRLRMADNDRRFARDLYAMQLMISSRRSVRFIVGRKSADGSPTPPSRLLAAAPPADSARRVRRLLEGTRKMAATGHRWDRGPAVTELSLPNIDPQSGPWPITSMRVTAFRDYLTCPYRFYLRHVLNLRPLDDDVSELAANQFGDLVHDTLELFGNSADRDETRAELIQQRLTELVRKVAADRYGEPTTAAVALQVAQAEKRLAIVARRQAERIAAGWRIHEVEKAVGEVVGACVEVDDRKMYIRGRIDRIDFHADSGRWAILDYKTNGDPPAKKHLKRSRPEQPWIDLQLPLYRRMAPFLGIDAEASQIELGYFNISQKEPETKINRADFGEDLMTRADELIEQNIRDIWDGKFEPTTERVQYDDYDMIL